MMAVRHVDLFMCVCRSRSMSEVDVLAANDVDEDVVVFHEQLIEPIQLTLFTPQLECTSVLPSPTITAPSLTSSLPRSYDVTRRAQRRPNGRDDTVLNITSTSSLSSSFYESGTMSASVSRDHSPQRYPRPPPNMIISPAHHRSLSADRTSSSPYKSALQRIVKRLSDVIDIDDDVISSGGIASATGRRHDNNAERHRGGHPQAAGSDVRTRDLMTSESGHVSRKAASHAEIASSLSSSSSSSPATAALSTTSSTSSASATSGSRLSRWTATLALFRKKSRRTENKQSSSTSAAAAAPSAAAAAAAAVSRPLQEQCASLSSGDVMASVETCSSSRQVHSNLSQSQPLHYSTAASLTSPASGLLATASSASSSRGSKLARIIDPLKPRRRPNSSSADLQTTLVASPGGEVASRRPHVLSTARSGTRRARYSLTSAYMQGSL